MTKSQRELYQRDESIRRLFLVKKDEEVREKILNILIDPPFTNDIKGKYEIQKIPSIKLLFFKRITHLSFLFSPVLIFAFTLK